MKIFLIVLYFIILAHIGVAEEIKEADDTLFSIHKVAEVKFPDKNLYKCKKGHITTGLEFAIYYEDENSIHQGRIFNICSICLIEWFDNNLPTAEKVE